MKLYTSCFANKWKYKDMITISIALWPPKDYKGYCSKKLAPSKDILNEYHRTRDEKQYTKRYKEEILGNLDCETLVKGTLEYIREKHGEKDICFLCFEKPGDFCHRKLVANWMKENGFECSEI